MGTDYNTTLFRNTFAQKKFGKSYESLGPTEQEQIKQMIQDKKKSFDPRIRKEDSNAQTPIGCPVLQED